MIFDVVVVVVARNNGEILIKVIFSKSKTNRFYMFNKFYSKRQWKRQFVKKKTNYT